MFSQSEINCIHRSMVACEQRSFSGENYKNNRDDISGKQSSHSTSTSTQNLKHSAPQKKTCLPGEGLDREKDPRSRLGSDCLVGCIWIVNCNGRRRPAPFLQASSGLFDQIGTLPINGLAGSARLG
jgi:hypothetical protein